MTGKRFSKVIKKDYSKGKSSSGKPSYDGLLLFKRCLLQNWYGLSDYEVAVTTTKKYTDSVDKQGTWLKKRVKYHFGFKKPYLTDDEGLVVLTTTASKNEISNLEDVLDTITDSFTRKHTLKSR